MKLTKIWFLFYISLPAGIVFRFLQLYFTIDAKTGFYMPYAEGYGKALLILIMLLTLAVGVFSYLCFIRPEKLPQKNIVTSVISCILAIIIGAESFIIKPAFSVLPWQLSAFNFASLLFVLFLISFAIAPYFNIKIPPYLSSIPTIYLIARTICDFTTVSKIALISDNIILISIYCVAMLFFINFARLYIGIDTDKCYKNILSLGLSSVVLSFSFAVPNLAIGILDGKSYPHISIIPNIIILLLGIFIFTFVARYFSKKNI